MINVRISVRNLIEFILREGDIDNRFGTFSDDAMAEGARLHRQLQKRAGSDYQAEVELAYTYVQEDVEISVFKLYKLVGIDGYIRLIDGEENKKIGFDGVDDPVINQVIHYYYNAKMEYEDLIYDSGVYGLVKMLCPIDDPIPAGIEEVDPFYPGK